MDLDLSEYDPQEFSTIDGFCGIIEQIKGKSNGDELGEYLQKRLYFF